MDLDTYMYIERERERETYMYVYIYIYIYVCMHAYVYMYTDGVTVDLPLRPAPPTGLATRQGLAPLGASLGLVRLNSASRALLG